LRVCARERIESGLLPRTKATRTWGGRGSGFNCCLCDGVIAASEPEMELEFEGNEAARSLRFHLQCHSVWDLERRVPEHGSWTPLEKTPPPFDTSVEARLSMGAGREVILGIVRTKGREGESVWMNAVTHAPLPAAWLPVEWRYPAGFEVADLLAESSAPKRA